MAKRRILLFSAQSLLGESLEQTLRRVPEVELAGHWPVDDQVLDHLACTEVDLVILTDENLSSEGLSNLTTRIIDRYPDVPVFRVTLERNLLQIFSSHMMPARSEDLIHLIQCLPLKAQDSGCE